MIDTIAARVWAMTLSFRAMRQLTRFKGVTSFRQGYKGSLQGLLLLLHGRPFFSLNACFPLFSYGLFLTLSQRFGL